MMYPTNRLSGAQGLLLKISRILCVAPIIITSNGIKYSKTYGLLSGVVAIALNMAVLFSFGVEMLTTESSTPGKYITIRVLWIASTSLITAISLVGTLGAQGRLKCLFYALNMMEKQNHKIGANRKSSERKQFIIIYICLLLNSILVIINLYADLLNIKEFNVTTIVVMFMFFLRYIVRQVLLLQFTLTASQLKDLLRDINEKLQEIKDKLDDGGTMVKSHKIGTKNINMIIDSLNMDMRPGIEEYIIQYTNTVRKLANIYICTCDIIEQVATKYGLLLFLLLNSFFLYLVVTPYYKVFSNIYVVIDEPSVYVLQIAWFIFNLFNMAIFVEPCHQTQVEMRKTCLLVSQLFRRVHTYDALYHELNVFYRVLLLKTTAYSPYGLCTLDRPLIVTIMGSVTTYLVIIFQFQSP